ncbi:MAG: SEC-C domain-containing protein [Proteobacteria bacterium]|nr:SEC-C domain-containing protein [Pseudomonadota bacterium]MBU0968459.1 SEC-C domain-containing protein [Pseudomonadota bacterium]
MKIGRNDPCPCGSGQKYKKCCHGKVDFKPVTGQPAPQVTLKSEIEKLQEVAEKKEKLVKPLGVFVLFSTEEGDAWLLEITEMDAVRVADKGSRIEVDLNENPETIEINWTHHFSIRKKQFVTTAYADEQETVWPAYPAHSIFSSIKRIRKKFPKELLGSIHLNEEDVSVGQA